MRSAGHGFADRRDAGRQLAARLVDRGYQHPVVLALPRGGVPVGDEVAHALKAPLDVAVVRKVGVPHQPELAMGAVGEGGELVIDEHTVRACGVRPDQIRDVVAAERTAVDQRVADYRDGREPLSVSGCTVIVVDDGVATGASVRAACQVVQVRGPHRIVVGVPVGPAETIEQLRAVCDEVVCVATPSQFFAVGQWYRDFAPVQDAEVRQILDQHRQAEPDN